jgi:hypothetical protein
LFVRSYHKLRANKRRVAFGKDRNKVKAIIAILAVVASLSAAAPAFAGYHSCTTSCYGNTCTTNCY